MLERFIRLLTKGAFPGSFAFFNKENDYGFFKTGNAAGKNFDEQAKEDVLHYILNPYKVKHGYCDGVNVNMSNPVADMQRVSEHFGKINGVQLRHLILSFFAIRGKRSSNGK